MFTGYDYRDMELEVARVEFILNGKKSIGVSIENDKREDSYYDLENRKQHLVDVRSQINKTSHKNTKVRK